MIVINWMKDHLNMTFQEQKILMKNNKFILNANAN